MSLTAARYRSCVGIALVNQEGKVFLGKRVNDMADTWQMPQGGVESGEHPLDAAYRELKEETGIVNAEFLYVMNRDLYYEIPNAFLYGSRRRRFIGQRQRWHLFKFTGSMNEIDVRNVPDPEFCKWRWADWDYTYSHVIHFKKLVYMEVIREFMPICQKLIKKKDWYI